MAAATKDTTTQKYYDALLASYDVMVEAISKAGDRGLTVSKQLANDIVKGQRDVIELGKKLSDPSDASQVYSIMIEATTAAQGRALAFTQVAYQAALSGGTEARETIQKLVEANKEATQAAVELAKKFATSNPYAEAWRKGLEAFQPH